MLTYACVGWNLKNHPELGLNVSDAEFKFRVITHVSYESVKLTPIIIK